MKFNVTFYQHITKYDGFRLQFEKSEKTEILNTKELMAVADLRHPILTKKEFFQTHLKDIKGNVRANFRLLARGSYHLEIKPIKKETKK